MRARQADPGLQRSESSPPSRGQWPVGTSRCVIDARLNPYRPGAGTRPPVLVGRDRLIQDFEICLDRVVGLRPGKSLMPLGLRGVGKTVLLNRFQEIAELRRCVTVFLEAPEAGDFRSQLAVRLRSAILTLRKGALSETVEKALRVLKSFTLQLPEGVAMTIDVEAFRGQADSGLLAEDLTDVLIAGGEAAMARDRGLLLAIDEVQYLGADDLGALIAAVHRTTQLDLPVMLVAVGLPQLAALAGEAKTYSERLFDFPEVGTLSRFDAKAALAVPAEDLGVLFTEEALEAIATASGGYPYFLQEWGFHIWNKSDRSPIAMTEVEHVRPIVQQQLDDGFFRVRFERLDNTEKAFLRAMAELGSPPHAVPSVVEQMGMPRRWRSRGDLVRDDLAARGLLYLRSQGRMYFSVPLFADFLLRRIPQPAWYLMKHPEGDANVDPRK